MSASTKPRRINLTVTREMRLALETLASKSGLRVTTQAMVTLRQALHQTIQSPAVQTALAQERAFRTRDEWISDQQEERALELALSVTEGRSDDAPPA